VTLAGLVGGMLLLFTTAGMLSTWGVVHRMARARSQIARMRAAGGVGDRSDTLESHSS